GQSATNLSPHADCPAHGTLNGLRSYRIIFGVVPAQRRPAASRGGDPIFAGIHVVTTLEQARRGWDKLGHDGGEWFDYAETRCCIILLSLAPLVSPECNP